MNTRLKIIKIDFTIRLIFVAYLNIIARARVRVKFFYKNFTFPHFFVAFPFLK